MIILIFLMIKTAFNDIFTYSATLKIKFWPFHELPGCLILARIYLCLAEVFYNFLQFVIGWVSWSVPEFIFLGRWFLIFFCFMNGPFKYLFCYQIVSEIVHGCARNVPWCPCMWLKWAKDGPRTRPKCALILMDVPEIGHGHAHNCPEMVPDVHVCARNWPRTCLECARNWP